MIILLQDKLRQRRKHLKRLQRHLAAPELHLWEKEEEEEDKGSKHGMAMLRQLSLGTSLSTSTLTDCGFPPLCSDGDTAENTSEAVSPEQQSRSINRYPVCNESTSITLRNSTHVAYAVICVVLSGVKKLNYETVRVPREELRLRG